MASRSWRVGPSVSLNSFARSREFSETVSVANGGLIRVTEISRAALAPVIPRTGKDDTNPTELASVVFGLLHYAEFVVQRPASTETSSVGFVSTSAACRLHGLNRG